MSRVQHTHIYHDLENCEDIIEQEQKISKILREISVDLELLKIILTTDENKSIMSNDNNFYASWGKDATMKVLALLLAGLLLSGCLTASNPFVAYHTDYGQTTYTPQTQNPFATNWYFPNLKLW